MSQRKQPGVLGEVRRYWRAFVTALRFTVRGEKPPLLKIRDQYPQFTAWMDETIRLVEAVERGAAANGIDLSTLTVRLDRRDVRATTILQAVRYHAQREYPYLMAHDDSFSVLTLQATNLNDLYGVQRVAEAINAPLKIMVEALSLHLGHIPNNSSA
jgi:hypothetical protein